MGGAKSFAWKKGPNNRYMKVSIAMDQVDEDKVVEDFAEPSPVEEAEETPSPERLARMEEALVEEAVKRSMRDLYAGM